MKNYTKTTAFGSDICVRMTYEWSDGQMVQQWYKLWQRLLPAGGIRMIVQCEHCLTAYHVLPENLNRGVSERISLTAFLEHRKSKLM